MNYTVASKRVRISRRDFIKFSGLTSLSVGISACVINRIPIPSPTFLLSATKPPLPTASISPTLSPSSTSSPSPTITNAPTASITSSPTDTRTPTQRPIIFQWVSPINTYVDGKDNWTKNGWSSIHLIDGKITLTEDPTDRFEKVLLYEITISSQKPRVQLDKKGPPIYAPLSIKFSIYPLGQIDDFDYWNILSSWKNSSEPLNALAFVNVENGGRNIVFKTKKPNSGEDFERNKTSRALLFNQWNDFEVFIREDGEMFLKHNGDWIANIPSYTRSTTGKKVIEKLMNLHARSLYGKDFRKGFASLGGPIEIIQYKV